MLTDIEDLTQKYYNNYNNSCAKVFYVSEKYVPDSKIRPRLVRQVMYLTFTKLIKRGVIPVRFGDVVVIKNYLVSKYGFIYDGRDLRSYDSYRKTNLFNVWQIHPSTGVFINSHYWKHIFGSIVKIRLDNIDLVENNVRGIGQQTTLSINENVCILNIHYHEFTQLIMAYREHGWKWSRGYLIKDKINVLY